MAFSKAHLYGQSELLTSGFAKAFSHPARLKILSKLIHEGPCTVQYLAKLHPISQPAISQHLENLRVLGLVTFREVFPYTFYSVNKRNLRKGELLIKAYLDSLGKRK
ncbi:MAG: metalloregulator ArsR/SmtB family transcription factor [Bacteroidota bacterium]|nr:metalloregulator ArsR/SmtB family transcription factor [Bacteroidota bacterium]